MTRFFTQLSLSLIPIALIANLAPAEGNPGKGTSDSLFARSNLVAWCIVPFDRMKRGPEERAEMLNCAGRGNWWVFAALDHTLLPVSQFSGQPLNRFFR